MDVPQDEQGRDSGSFLYSLCYPARRVPNTDLLKKALAFQPLPRIEGIV